MSAPKVRPAFTVNGVPFGSEREALAWATNIGQGGLAAAVWMRAGNWSILLERWEGGRRTFPSGKVTRWRSAG